MLRLLRKGILIYILILVGVGAWLANQRATSWESTLWVAIYPINGDASRASADYIANLRPDAFDVIDLFMAEEAEHHHVAIAEPVHLVVGPTLDEQPPLPPAKASALQIMFWSLKLRYWAWRVDRGEDPPPSKVDIFVRYFDPDQSPRLAHSLGLQKGHLGVVNAFARADQAGSNKVIIAHELLHTLGATDKYDPSTNQPTFPDGFAEPDAEPRLPQSFAELMGGRIPISATQSRIPHSLDEVVIGTATAKEIRWLK